ncbi:MAG: hypothetical protein ACPGSW_00390 [Phaeobacter italicus]
MKIILLPTPSYDDLQGWKDQLAELQAQDDDVVGKEANIAYAQAIIDALIKHPPKTPSEAA